LIRKLVEFLQVFVCFIVKKEKKHGKPTNGKIILHKIFWSSGLFISYHSRAEELEVQLFILSAIISIMLYFAEIIAEFHLV